MLRGGRLERDLERRLRARLDLIIAAVLEEHRGRLVAVLPGLDLARIVNPVELLERRLRGGRVHGLALLRCRRRGDRVGEGEAVYERVRIARRRRVLDRKTGEGRLERGVDVEGEEGRTVACERLEGQALVCGLLFHRGMGAERPPKLPREAQLRHFAKARLTNAALHG